MYESYFYLTREMEVFGREQITKSTTLSGDVCKARL